MRESPVIQSKALYNQGVRASYQVALSNYRGKHKLLQVSWVTWVITSLTVAVWFFTAYQVALASGARSLREIVANVFANTENADVLITYGAKYNLLIHQGQYWRFITPVFLHANLLHISLNMLNFVILGVFIERIFGHFRILFIYLITGVISVTSSVYFAPQEVSIGASGAIFGLVGAYSIFVLLHRRALSLNGLPALAWLLLIVGVNLALGFVMPDVDNSAHISGLISGCLLGWFFAPSYQLAQGPGSQLQLIDKQRLARRWPLVVLAILGTILLAIIALHLSGG